MQKTKQHKEPLETRKADLRAAYSKAWLNLFRCGGQLSSKDDDLFTVYTMMWGIAPNKISGWEYPMYLKERLLTGSTFVNKCVDGSEKDNEKWDEIVIDNTQLNLIKYYQENDIAYITIRDERGCILVSENKEMIFEFSSFMVLAPYEYFPQYMLDAIVFTENRTTRYYYLAQGKDGVRAMDMNIRDIDVDIEMNYNDDLPYTEIIDALESEESSIIIFRGKPGTAKSTLIRHLISRLDDRDFVYLDHSCFDMMTDASFIETLADYENSVLILEDCEDMVKDRSHGNSKMAALLNLSDGLLADSFKFKILCTFNADVAKIDKALLRKGRLKIDYEFKELTPAKTATLASKLGKDIKPGESLTVGDIYNYGETVEFSQNDKKCIGFNI